MTSPWLHSMAAPSRASQRLVITVAEPQGDEARHAVGQDASAWRANGPAARMSPRAAVSSTIVTRIISPSSHGTDTRTRGGRAGR